MLTVVGSMFLSNYTTVYLGQEIVKDYNNNNAANFYKILLLPTLFPSKLFSNRFYLPSDFITQRLAWNYSYFLTYSFICVKIKSQSSVVLLNDDTSGFFDGLCPYATL